MNDENAVDNLHINSDLESILSAHKSGELVWLVQEKSGYYKPLIEARAGVGLGRILVKEHATIPQDIMNYWIQEKVLLNATTKRRIPTPFDYDYYRVQAFLKYVQSYSKLIKDQSIPALMTYMNKTIYVNVKLWNSIIKESIQTQDMEELRRMDNYIVHELSHALWDAIQGYSDRPGTLNTWDEKEISSLWLERPYMSKNEIARVWKEGFAVYCADYKFRDFYPSLQLREWEKTHVKGAYDVFMMAPYRRGLYVVREYVERNGEESLWQIPVLWKQVDIEAIINKQNAELMKRIVQRTKFQQDIEQKG